MKKIFTICLVGLGLITLVLSSCKEDDTIKSIVKDGVKPVAAFTASSGSLSVTFNNTSTSAESYYWQFGDGTSSTEKSPVHNYAVPGKFKVTLKVTSEAGYSNTIEKVVPASAAAIADFEVSAASFGLNTVFLNTSTAADAVVWDFGDGTATSTATAPDHKFAAFGTYNVKLTVTGLLGDVVVKTKAITIVDNNLVKGGSFETGENSFWTAYSTGVVPTYGHTTDKPSAGYNGCLRWPSFTGSVSGIIYQAVQVTSGKKYRFTAQVKVPAGATFSFLQFYISKSNTLWVENNSSPDNNFIYGLNTWNGWGSNQNSKALDGEISQLAPLNGGYGLLVATNGVYTATLTGTVYVGIGVLTSAGKSNGDFLVDNVSLVMLP